MSDDLAERCKSLGRVLEEQWLLDAGHEIERLRGLVRELFVLDDEMITAIAYSDLARRVREALSE